MKEDNSKEEKVDKPKKKFMKNTWKIASIASMVLSVILIGVIITGSSPSGVTGMITADVAAERAITFIEDNMVAPGTEVSVKDIVEENGLYRLVMEVKSGTMTQEVESYITTDGKIFFPQAINMGEFEKAMEEAEEQQGEEQSEPQTQEVQKTDKPEVHAFVMSYCPYGLQFMKAYVPVIELLEEKADLELNFVSYAMHGKKELDENLRMYCIQKEQNEKLTDYLRCFVEKDDYEQCIKNTEIDSEKLESCMQSADEEFNITGLYEDKSTWSNGRFPQFPVEAEMNEEYMVRGSPSFVINDAVIVSSQNSCPDGDVNCVVFPLSRSPEAIKDAICFAFNNPPEECEQELSDKAEQPGIGPIGSGSGASSGGQC